MNTDGIVTAIAWALLVMVIINIYFVWHGGRMWIAVYPRSPVLGALWWTKFSIWLLNLYFAVIAYRYLNHLEPVLPFGGLGLGIVILFVLTVPGVIHSKMTQFIDREQQRADTNDA